MMQDCITGKPQVKGGVCITYITAIFTGIKIKGDFLNYRGRN
jgi:hypothetical protein